MFNISRRQEPIYDKTDPLLLSNCKLRADTPTAIRFVLFSLLQIKSSGTNLISPPYVYVYLLWFKRNHTTYTRISLTWFCNYLLTLTHSYLALKKDSWQSVPTSTPPPPLPHLIFYEDPSLLYCKPTDPPPSYFAVLLLPFFG